MATVKLEMTPEQAAAVAHMLDLAVRTHMGQFWELEMEARFGAIKHKDGRELGMDERDTLRHLLSRVSVLFGFDGGASFGIGSQHVSDDAHRAYEVRKVLEKSLAMSREPNPKGIRGVNYDGLLVRYTNDPAPVAEVRE